MPIGTCSRRVLSSISCNGQLVNTRLPVDFGIGELDTTMESLHFHHKVNQRAAGTKVMAIVGVVASGNLEVLVERILPDSDCELDIKTAAEGFGAGWQLVVADFVELRSPGGLKLSINDGGARPDTVAIRLAQAVGLIEDVDT